MKIISIEGNIGSGKSTLLENLKREFKDNKNIIFLREPVDEWESIRDSTGTSMLEKFYADQDKYSFSFQMMAYISRLALLKKAAENDDNYVIITERSLYTDKYVFAQMLYDNGKIEDVNYQIYLKWFDTFAQDFPVDKIIYVNTSPEICYNRINKRSREGESKISLEYLHSCHKYHTDMLSKADVCQNQLVIDGNVDIGTHLPAKGFQRKTDILQVWIQKISEFM